MDKADFGADFAEAFTKTTELYELAEEEKEFVFRVFVRFRILTIEARELITKTQKRLRTDNERKMAAIEISFFYAKSIKEELLIGLHNYRRQELIIRALRGIVVLTLPSGIVDYMLDVFNHTGA